MHSSKTTSSRGYAAHDVHVRLAIQVKPERTAISNPVDFSWFKTGNFYLPKYRLENSYGIFLFCDSTRSFKANYGVHPLKVSAPAVAQRKFA